MIALATPPRWAERELARIARLALEFVRLHGVREFRNSHRNVLAVLRSSGAPEGRVRRAMKLIAPWGHIIDGPFDHGQVFGRSGRALLLVGHPYTLTDEHCAALEAIRAL